MTKKIKPSHRAILDVLRSPGGAVWSPFGASMAWLCRDNRESRQVRVSTLREMVALGLIRWEAGGGSDSTWILKESK